MAQTRAVVGGGGVVVAATASSSSAVAATAEVKRTGATHTHTHTRTHAELVGEHPGLAHRDRHEQR